jgi:hypothetical protein
MSNPTMTRRLKRIGPVKFGLILGMIYGLISLLIVPVFLLVAVVAALAPHPGAGAAAQGLGIVGALAMCIFLPIMYAVMGCLVGMLMAWLYNVAAAWIGGIEFEVE